MKKRKHVAEWNNKINTLSKKNYNIQNNNLTYYFKGESNPITFNKMKKKKKKKIKSKGNKKRKMGL